MTAEQKPGQAKGARNSNSKLTPNIVRKARREYLAGATYPELAKKYGVNDQVMGKAIRGDWWGHVAPQIIDLSDIPTGELIAELRRRQKSGDVAAMADDPKPPQ